MKPTDKSPAMVAALEGLSGRSTAIEGNVCIPAPFGCGGPAVDFRNAGSVEEYRIGGMCQACQDAFYGVEEE